MNRHKGVDCPVSFVTVRYRALSIIWFFSLRRMRGRYRHRVYAVVVAAVNVDVRRHSAENRARSSRVAAPSRQLYVAPYLQVFT